jgi:starch phosphorylase
LVDYDMDLAEHLVHGVDLWVNTPRRPWEASGTSGMKVLVNGGLNLSVLDGWWAEAYRPEVGWSLGDGLEHGEDPAVDAAEAAELYDLLENEIIPEFYDRDTDGIPRRWIARVRESMATLTPFFSTNRMMVDYLDQYYVPGAAAYRDRVGRDAARLLEWKENLDAYWDDLRFVEYSVKAARGPDGETHVFRATVSHGAVPSNAFHVQVYAEPGEVHVLEPERGDRVAGGPEPQTRGGGREVLAYSASIPALRPAGDYTPRIVPWHPAARVPLECERILWYR